MRKMFLATCVAMLALLSCSQNENMSCNNVTEVEVAATTASATTRTHINESYQTVWDANDCIATVVTGQRGTRLVRFDLKSQPNSSRGVFGGFILEGETLNGYAIYPYADDLSLEGNRLTLSLPASCEYDAQPAAPMLAKSGYGSGSFSFKHLCGILKFTIRNVPPTAQTFTLTTSSAINGLCEVTDITSDAPILVCTSSDAASHSISVNLPQTDTDTDFTFYIPVPPATYTSMSISLTDAQGTELMSSSSTATNVVGRSMLTTMPTMIYTEVPSDIEEDNVNGGNEGYTPEEGTWD